MLKQMRLTVNGEAYTVAVKPNRMLVDLIREDLGFTGTKKGCDMGICGTCTMLLDNELVSACLVPALRADGKEVLTIEGLASAEGLHPLQQAFVDAGAIQCGYCTPGMVLTAKALLDENPDPSEEEIREHIHGNYCRCTGYVKIVHAIQDAAHRVRGVR